MGRYLLAILLLSGCASIGPHDYQDCRIAYFNKRLDAGRSLEHVIEDSELVCSDYKE